MSWQLNTATDAVHVCMQALAELWAAEASKAAAVSAAQLRYTRLAARLRTMQASANQRVRSAFLATKKEKQMSMHACSCLHHAPGCTYAYLAGPHRPAGADHKFYRCSHAHMQGQGCRLLHV